LIRIFSFLSVKYLESHENGRISFAPEAALSSAHTDCAAELLDALRAILERQGLLSGLIIDEEDSLPSSSAYLSRFGSLLRAYRLIGYEPDRDYSYIERPLRDCRFSAFLRRVAMSYGPLAWQRTD